MPMSIVDIVNGTASSPKGKKKEFHCQLQLLLLFVDSLSQQKFSLRFTSFPECRLIISISHFIHQRLIVFVC